MQEMREASVPDLFGGREKRCPQYIQIPPEKQESFLGSAPAPMNRCLQAAMTRSSQILLKRR